MVRIDNELHHAEWLSTLRAPGSETDAYARVQHIMPSGFARYVKLLHPIYVDPTVSDRAASWHAAEAHEGFVGVKSGGTLVRESSHGHPRGERVYWRQLAARYGVPWSAEINDASYTRRFPDKSWPRYLLGPDEGTLDDRMCQALVSVLSVEGRDQTTFFYYSGLSVLGYQPRLYCGELEEVLTLDSDDLFATPEYWWPQNRAWCVHTSWDLSFTLVGCSPPSAQAIENHADLETILVSPTTRIDWRADE